MACRLRSAAAAILAAVALLSHLATAAKLPASFKRCKAGDPQLGGCMKEAIKVAVGELAKGAPSLGVLPIDPLAISALSIGRGSGPVDVSLDFKDLTIHGLSSAVIETASFDTKTLSLDMQTRFPGPVSLLGQYRIDGKVLVLPITGEGRCNLTFADLTTTAKIRAEKVVKDGQTYGRVLSFGFSLQPQRLHMDFENLFNGDKALGDNMNKFLNENWQEILKELQPAVEEAFGATFKEIVNRIYQRVPYKDLLLE
ncbi:protein takeout-like [Schistocerca piceifrons]|uniref:protein takeout-like n=1 Tax=Schistocerca piceifrons TaxID=274613 RepID=UPI001F5F91A3|nr:protein takeout-like [Schistocerca piceifrons]